MVSWNLSFYVKRKRRSMEIDTHCNVLVEMVFFGFLESLQAIYLDFYKTLLTDTFVLLFSNLRFVS